MKSVTNKIDSLRVAVAESRIRVTAATLKRIASNDLPKKDVLTVSRVAGVMAAKRTPDLLPYCHPIFIDHVEIEFEMLEGEIVISATVEAVAKTGVEMEALTAASVTALALYDMLKPVDDDLEIFGTKLLRKIGGKTSFVEKIPAGFKAAVIVTSDGTSSGIRRDISGRIIEERLKALGIESSYEILPDEKNLIASSIRANCAKGVNLVITTGGTGLGPRDVTVEATKEVVDREISGIMEAARSFGQKRTPYAMLSRGIAGQKGKTLVVNFPGSSKGVEESLDAVFPHVLHAYKMMRGQNHE